MVSALVKERFFYGEAMKTDWGELRSAVHCMDWLKAVHSMDWKDAQARTYLNDHVIKSADAYLSVSFCQVSRALGELSDLELCAALYGFYMYVHERNGSFFSKRLPRGRDLLKEGAELSNEANVIRWCILDLAHSLSKVSEPKLIDVLSPSLRLAEQAFPLYREQVNESLLGSYHRSFKPCGWLTINLSVSRGMAAFEQYSVVTSFPGEGTYQMYGLSNTSADVMVSEIAMSLFDPLFSR